MKRIVRLAAGAVALAFTAGPAVASGDYSCTPVWKLSLFDGMECGNRAMLSPGNDTRANMFFLQRNGMGILPEALPRSATDWEDRSLGRSFFNWGTLAKLYVRKGDEDRIVSGSRCDSLDSGKAAFLNAMAANARLSATDRDTLTKARENLSSRCSAGNGAGTPAPWPDRLSGAPAHAFLGYLQGADAFYAGAWDDARKSFAGLRNAADKWVAETAAYMLIRVDLNAAQENAFDEYGYFQGASATDKVAVGRAEAAIASYLKRYPKGLYAASAQGLKRRVLWLGGDNAGLAREYERLLASVAPGTGEAVSLVQEIDNKLLFANDAGQAIQTPQLLAAFDLLQMRGGDDTRPLLSAADLAVQKDRFAKQPQLYTYLLAAQALYVDRDYRRVLSLIPASGKDDKHPLAFSQQMLRGMALAGLRDPQEEAHWQAMIPQAHAPYQRELAELGLALAWQRNGKLAAVFAPGSPIQDSTIRETLLSRIAGPDLLRQVAADGQAARRVRDVALFTLLQKNLATGRYADFRRDRAMIPADAAADDYLWDFPSMENIPVGLFASGKWSDGYLCPTLSATAEVLSRNPADAKGKLCLADFWRLNGFDHFTALDPETDADTLGAGPGQFPSIPVTRAAIYASVLADPRSAAEEKAYALYRSVSCYAPSGNNDCGGEDVPVTQRRAWYQQLKKDYPSSRWARSLSYYW